MTVIVVDDHRMFRDSIATFLAGEEFCDHVLSAAEVSEAKALITDHAPDVALVDLSFPGEGGTTLVEWGQSVVPDMASIFLTMHEDIRDLRRAIAAGGRGYVTKAAGYDELRTAVQTVAAGGVFLDQLMLRRVFQSLRDEPPRTDGGAPAVAGLTEREEEIVTLMLQDMSTAEIGAALFISAKTVENHRSSIYRKLGVHDRLSLFNYARRNGMLD